MSGFPEKMKSEPALSANPPIGTGRGEVPDGYCQCGCGEKTKLAYKTIKRIGWIKGKPQKFIRGHQNKNVTGSKHPRWKGGRIKIAGYIYVYCPSHPNSTYHGYVAEHRLIIEHKLERYLDKNEVSHHINKIKTDNRPENLKHYANHSQHIILEHLPTRRHHAQAE